MDPYEALANAIILQAVKDYRNAGLQQDMHEIERFFRSGWFGVLTTIDPGTLIHNLKEEKKR